jgi:GDPmannose 4,6-dehydratase
MWLMLQQEEAEDLVIATGECRSVREFAEAAFNLCGIKLQWVGNGLNEKGVDSVTGRELICCSSAYYRPIDVPYLRGDYTRAKMKLGWSPKVSFDQLVELMVCSDLLKHNLECPFIPSYTERLVEHQNYKGMKA